MAINLLQTEQVSFIVFAMSTKLIMVEMTREFAEKLLPMLREERDRLDLQIRRIEGGITAAQEAPAKESAARQFPLVAPSRSSGGLRAKKGESEKLIVVYLASIAPKKAAAKEIAGVTKTAYGSALRILRKLKKRGDAVSIKRQWKLAEGRNGSQSQPDLVGQLTRA